MEVKEPKPIATNEPTGTKGAPSKYDYLTLKSLPSSVSRLPIPKEQEQSQAGHLIAEFQGVESSDPRQTASIGQIIYPDGKRQERASLDEPRSRPPRANDACELGSGWCRFLGRELRACSVDADRSWELPVV